VLQILGTDAVEIQDISFADRYGMLVRSLQRRKKKGCRSYGKKSRKNSRIYDRYRGVKWGSTGYARGRGNAKSTVTLCLFDEC